MALIAPLKTRRNHPSVAPSGVTMDAYYNLTTYGSDGLHRDREGETMIDRFIIFYCTLLLSIFFLLTAQPVSGEAGVIDTSQEAANQEAATAEEFRQILSASNLKDFLAGVDPSEIILETGETLASVLLSPKASTFGVSWYSFSNGGSATEGGEFALIATIGQAVAGETTGGEFSVMTGFGSGFEDLGIFSDGFEAGDLSAWSSSIDN